MQNILLFMSIFNLQLLQYIFFTSTGTFNIRTCSNVPLLYDTIKFANEEIYPHASPVFVLCHPIWHDSTPVTSRVRHKTLCNMRQVHGGFPALLPLVRVYMEISFQRDTLPMNNMKLHFDLPQEDE